MILRLEKLNRWQAAASHLSASILIFAGLFGLLVYSWYPEALLSAGGTEGFKLVACIDLVLGPLLTLLIYNPAKGLGKLKFDLATILLAQLSALSYGIYNLYGEKPEAVIVSYDGAHILSHNDILNSEIKKADLDKISTKRPIIAVLDLPSAKKEAKAIEYAHALTGEGLIYNSSLYLDIQDLEKNPLFSGIAKKVAHNKCVSLPLFSKHLDNGQSHSVCISIENKKVMSVN